MQPALVDYTLIMSIISTDIIVVIVAYALYDPSLFVVRCVFGYGPAITVQFRCWRLLRLICKSSFLCVCVVKRGDFLMSRESRGFRRFHI